MLWLLMSFSTKVIEVANLEAYTRLVFTQTVTI